MKVRQVFIFIVSVLILLLILSLVFPEKGLKITEDYRLEFLNFEELINPPEQEMKNIDSLLALTHVGIQEDTAAFEEKKEPKRDSVMIDSQYVYFEPKPIRIDSVTQFIEFPKDNREMLYPFFELLAAGETQKKIVRIMHFGDSQIEVDRMSGYFRMKLQYQFGGYGPGLVPAVQPYPFSLPMEQSYDGDWNRYTIYGIVDTTVNHRRYGMMGTFSRFSPIELDSTFSVINPDMVSGKTSLSASLTYKISRYAKRRARTYKRCRMFYGYNRDELKLKVFADDKQIDEKTIAANQKSDYETWEFEENPKSLRFEFEAKDSPDFYGFAFDGFTGIAVDNIPMRGADGLSFTRMDLKMLSRFFKILNTKMLFLQFGGNAVPGNRESYDFYRKAFSYQLRTLKKIAPEMSIVVIGPADMSVKKGDIYVTNPNVIKVRDALKEAAFQNNCPFWDMYEAMGGENSMPSWVFHKPPLAGKDFIHFTPQGSNYIAQMFYSAFMYEYNRYLREIK